MELTKQEVEHIAALARLGLNEEELERMRVQLSSILGHVNQLSELDTEAIPPTAQVIALRDVMAADEPRPSPSRDEMLANAPDQEGGYFKVKAVLGYET
jgi:aspartyl-tRNA(Asn)/glutamyl-tRNA(Gln) amidotransferase subunit C